MNRRSFLRSLLAGAAGFVAAKCLPPMPARKELPPGPESVSVHFIEMYEVDGRFIHRMDVLYGFGTLSPSFACRVLDDTATPKRLGARAPRRMKRRQQTLAFNKDAFAMAWPA